MIILNNKCTKGIIARRGVTLKESKLFFSNVGLHNIYYAFLTFP